MLDRIEVTITGRVQMVMFRDFATRKARGLKLAGEVKNMRNGTVQLVAEGPRAALETFLQKLHHGPLLARVDTVEVSWQPATGEYKKFTLIYGSH